MKNGNSPIASPFEAPAASLVILVVILLTSALLRWISPSGADWATADKINSLVAIGTLGLAVSTVFLSRYTSASVLLSQRLIESEDIRHRQSLVPILKARLIYDNQTSTISGLELINQGLGPALSVSVSGMVEYQQHNSCTGITAKKSWPMTNVIASAVAANGTAIVTTGAPPDWVLGKESGSGTITILYQDLFGMFYKSVGLLFQDYYAWEPPEALFSLEERATLLQSYLSTLRD